MKINLFLEKLIKFLYLRYEDFPQEENNFYLRKYYIFKKPLKILSLNYRNIPRGNNTLYLRRYYLFRKLFNWMPSVYIHCFHSSDEDLELHSHPWSRSISLILSGSYSEERLINNKIYIKKYSPGNINYILGTDFHRVDLLTPNVWTLFISGSKIKDWGFWDRNTGEYTQWEAFIERKKQAKNAELKEKIYTGSDLSV